MNMERLFLASLRSKRGWMVVWAVLPAAIVVVGWSAIRGSHKAVSAGVENTASASPAAPAETAHGGVQVELVKPSPGGLKQTSRQPGSVHAFQWAALYSKVSGYLKTQAVDIGDTVKQGQVLAVIDAPELEAEVQQAAAALAEAKSEVEQMKARITTAEAKWQAAVAAAAQAEDELGRAVAERDFREQQYRRIKNLYDLKSIDERLVDEKRSEMLAAQASEKAAHSAIATAKADVAAAAANIEEARANLRNSQSKVQVAQSLLDKNSVWAAYRNIVSPYSGVITKRNFHPGDYVHGDDRNGERPLLVVERIDRLRVVTIVPDSNVPWAIPGRAATVQIDAMPGESFRGVISRTAASEDPDSRTMRVEVDLPNPNGRLRPGMYGQVTLDLHTNRAAVVLPVSCLVGPQENGKAAVYVVRGGKAARARQTGRQRRHPR